MIGYCTAFSCASLGGGRGNGSIKVLLERNGTWSQRSLGPDHDISWFFVSLVPPFWGWPHSCTGSETGLKRNSGPKNPSVYLIWLIVEITTKLLYIYITDITPMQATLQSLTCFLNFHTMICTPEKALLQIRNDLKITKLFKLFKYSIIKTVAHYIQISKSTKVTPLVLAFL